jgi:hypothetical protein
MEHFYKNIPGYFDYEDVYAEVVKNAKDGHHFVEIGAWYGQSTAFLAVEIINSNKKIKFDVVDTWKGSEQMYDPTNPAYDKTLIEKGTIYPQFIENMNPVISFINPIEKDSVDASSLYDDKSLDFVFIDAEHKYEYVIKDIESWLPKVKPGGIISGHDYGWDGVTRAINEVFGKDRYKTKGQCWIVNI